MTVNIYEYGSKIKEEITEFLKNAGVESYELTGEIKRTKEKNADFRAWAGDKEGWYEFITHAESIEAINRVKDTCFKVINILSKQKREEEQGKEKKNTEWWKENSNYWQESNDWWKKYRNNELDWQKDQKKRDEENKKQLEESEKNKDDKDKKRFITDIEMELTKENITDERLSKRLGVSDWRSKLETDGFYPALSMRSHLWDIIRLLKKEFTCASCGEKKEEYYNYPLEGGKKYCSAECWDKGEKNGDGKDKKKNDSPADRKSEFKDFSISEFFGLMKKLGAKKFWFDFDTNQVMLEFNDGKKQSLNTVDSGLSSEKRQKLENQLKTAGQITYDEASKEANKGKPGNNGNGGIIAAIVVVGIFLAVIIGVVVYKSRKQKDY